LLAIETATAASPVTLTTVLAISRILSTPRIRATPALGTPIDSRIIISIMIPAAGVALILGVDRILDMARTVVNVTGDAAVAVSIASNENQLKSYGK
jgi:Na+/H+-dicarboxylate symporter